MKPKRKSPVTPIELLGMFFPTGILDYFDLVDHFFHETYFILFLDGKPEVPPDLFHLRLHSKGFFPEVEVQDFPIRGKAIYLRIKRRRWEEPTSGQTYSRDWNLVAFGTRITAEFGAFSKALLGQSCS